MPNDKPYKKSTKPRIKSGMLGTGTASNAARTLHKAKKDKARRLREIMGK